MVRRLVQIFVFCVLWMDAVFCGDSEPCQIGKYTCQCSNTDGDRVVDCRDLYIDSIPDIPVETTKLNLSNNPITEARFPRLPNLRELRLQITLVETINEDSFSNLPSLRTLYLEGRSIKHIRPLAFVNNPVLLFVQLAENPLECTCDYLAMFQWAFNRKPTWLNLFGAKCRQDGEWYRYRDAKGIVDCTEYDNPLDRWGDWSEWATCEGRTSTSTRSRECQGNKLLCQGPGNEEKHCRLFCRGHFRLEETSQKLFRWPQTFVGDTAKVPCGKNVTGVARRECSKRSTVIPGGPKVYVGQWAEPNFGQCPESTGEIVCQEHLHEDAKTRKMFHWPETRIGSTAFVPCAPHDYGLITADQRRRNATRKCSSLSTVIPGDQEIEVGRWEQPNYEQCSGSVTEATEDFTDIITKAPIQDHDTVSSEALDNLKLLSKSNATQDLIEAATYLVKLTEKSEKLKAPDIDMYVKSIRNIRQVDTMKHTEEQLIESLSNLLSCTEEALEEGERVTKVAGRIVDEIHEFTKTITTDSRKAYINHNLAIVAVNKNQAGSDGIVFRVKRGNKTTFSLQDFDNDGGDATGGNILTEILVPKAVLNNSTSETVNFAIYGKSIVFQSVQKKQRINSKVVVTTVGETSVHNLRNDENVIFHLRKTNEVGTSRTLCSFWQPENGKWSQEGCRLLDDSPEMVTCGCDHMTNFALLMDVYGTVKNREKSESHHEVLTILTYIGLTVSLFGVLVTMALYIYHRKDLLKDNSTRILMCICCCLAVTYIVFLSAGAYSHDDGICKLIACILHFFLLGSFTWTLVAAFHMYQSLIIVFQKYCHRFLLKAAIFACGLPVLVIALTIGIDVDNYGLQKSLCWLRPVPFYAAFVAVIALIIIVNLVVFILVVAQLRRMAKRREETLGTSKQNFWGNFRALATIFTNLGLTWICGFLYLGEEASIVVQYLFVILVTTQGLVIFFLYCVGRKDARYKLCPCIPKRPVSQLTQSNNHSSTVSKRTSQDTKFTQVSTCIKSQEA